MAKARRRLHAGRLAAGMVSQRDEAVLSSGGARADSVLYDFAVDGGAIGVIDFGRIVPAGAVVVAVTAHLISALTSGGSATVHLKAGSTALIAATAFGAVATGTVALAGSATAIPLSTSPTENVLTLTIAGAAVTGGSVRLWVRYLLQNDVV